MASVKSVCLGTRVYLRSLSEAAAQLAQESNTLADQLSFRIDSDIGPKATCTQASYDSVLALNQQVQDIRTQLLSQVVLDITDSKTGQTITSWWPNKWGYSELRKRAQLVGGADNSKVSLPTGTKVAVKRSDGSIRAAKVSPADRRYLSRQQEQDGYILVRTGGARLARVHTGRSVWALSPTNNSRIGRRVTLPNTSRTGGMTKELRECRDY